MYSDAVSKKVPLLAVFIVAALLLAGAVWAFAGNAEKDLGAESAAAIEDAVQKSALQCYAVEGIYPPDLEYLQTNYGLAVNTKDFIVVYDAFASNLPPTIIVTPVRGEE